MCGSAVTLPVSSRTTTSWRTWASATRRWSWGLPAATACSSSTSSGASSRVSSKSRSRHRFSRRPTIGCTSRTGRSSVHRPVRLRAEGEVADLALVVGHDAHGDAAHLGGERHPGEPGREHGGGLLLVDREVGPVHVEVDDRLVAGRPVGDQVGEQPGQLGAVGDLVDRRGGADQVRVAPVEVVVGRGDGPAVDGDLAQVAQVVLAVVPLDEHGEHRLARGHAVAQPGAEEAHDALRDGGQGVEARGALVALGQGVDLLELVAHRAEHGGAVGVDERLVEPAEAHAAGEVADDREAQLGGGHQAVEQLARRGLGVGRRERARRASAAGSRWPSTPRGPSAAGRGTPGTRRPRGPRCARRR